MKVKDASDIRRIDASRAPDIRRNGSERAAAATDKVTTDGQVELKQATDVALAAAGANRTVRLASIEAAIRAGTFKPDPQRIASQILDDAVLTAQVQAMLRK